MLFSKGQTLNQWAQMLQYIYGRTQNYDRSKYEVFSHLTEVTGAFGRHLLKRKDIRQACEFLPKLFSWSVALDFCLKGSTANLEQTLLSKFPGVCPYCREWRCECAKYERKPSMDVDALVECFRKNGPTITRRSPSDFQAAFGTIYGHTWPTENDPHGLTALYAHLVEELAEIAEAMRFAHLYPTNFDNEIADFLAWWFAIVSTITEEARPLDANEILWRAYPGICLACGLDVCDCRPAPVRELISKPSIGNLAYFDETTQTENRNALNEQLNSVEGGMRPLPVPYSCVLIDVDDFKAFNTRFQHKGGDEALLLVASTIRGKLRARDRLYRYGGDEFAVISPDLSKSEAAGLLRRAVLTLGQAPYRGQPITLSIGIAEGDDPRKIRNVLEAADKAATASKDSGKNKITVE